MPRRDIIFARGQYYHIFNRGAGRQTLFKEESNFDYVLRKANQYCQEFKHSVIAFCLLPNHYHFLIRQDGKIPVSELPKRVFGGYSRAVFRKYGWSGTLFEGRYKAKLVDTDAYLFHLCRYIHANPVIHGIVEQPEDWFYSNYQEWLGERVGKLTDKNFIIDNFPETSTNELFVQEYLKDRQSPNELAYLDEWD